MNDFCVDVCIPAYHPDASFGKLLSMLLEQSWPVHRILIMNTDEKGWNPEFSQLSEKIQVTHITKQEFDHGGTRDRMARMSDADYILFMTHDAVPFDRDLIRKMAVHFSLSRVKAVYARQLPRKQADELERYTRSFNYPDESAIKDADDLPKLGIKTFFCSNVCAMYDRATYLELGGFVRHTPFNEDMIYAGKLIRAGYAISYAADARVVHSHNYGCVDQFKRNFDLGASQAMHRDLFDAYPSEGEGIKMVRKTAKHMIEIGKPWLIGKLFFQSAAKYLGYRAGRHFMKLPVSLIMKFTSNPGYWRYYGIKKVRMKKR